MGTILVKSALNALKIEVFKKKISLKKFNLVAHFLLLTFFENFNFWKHLKHFLLKLYPFFVSWFWSFVKKYENDKVVNRIGCATWNSNLKSYLIFRHLTSIFWYYQQNVVTPTRAVRRSKKRRRACSLSVCMCSGK